MIVHDDGSIEIREGAYDGHYHFLNGRTGRPIRPDLVTGDLAKGSATSDPDGYPLYYAGSRDNLFRIVAMDRPSPTVLWSIERRHDRAAAAVEQRLGRRRARARRLPAGGRREQLALRREAEPRLRRRTGKVTVDPKIVATIPGCDDQLLADVGDDEVSIENSVAFRDGVVYFANSGGLVQGWDISDLLRGGTTRTTGCSGSGRATTPTRRS